MEDFSKFRQNPVRLLLLICLDTVDDFLNPLSFVCLSLLQFSLELFKINPGLVVDIVFESQLVAVEHRLRLSDLFDHELDILQVIGMATRHQD